MAGTAVVILIVITPQIAIPPIEMEQSRWIKLSRHLAEARLKISVHAYAFRKAPTAYLTATKWWLLRKRVRARGQFAPLLSRSPNAYTLWAIKDDRQRRGRNPHDGGKSIVGLIDLNNACDSHMLTATIESLCAEGIDALVIGSRETPNLAEAVAQIDWSQKPWLLMVSAGDLLAHGAAQAYQAAAMNSHYSVIYADDDLLDHGGLRISPHFKPDWNSELFEHFDYLSYSCIVRVDQTTLAAADAFSDWPYQVVKRALEQGSVLHLQEMLHHRSMRAAPKLPLMAMPVVASLPMVSIIVPTRNRVDLLRTCFCGIDAADYPNLEVLVVDNDSDDPETINYLMTLDSVRYRVLQYSGPFNYSAINNFAASQANGELLCLLNNDVEMIIPEWLGILASHALRPDVGAVGAQLLYPDGRIQHAGVVIGVGNAAGHAHRLLRPDETGYFHRHALPQFTSAVTGACLVVAKGRFWAVGGFDELNFAVAFNDVDLCLRLNQKGWQSLYEPRAKLIHHESLSRGFDTDPIGAERFCRELAALKRIWETDVIFDPYHHPKLSRASEQFSVAI